MKKEDRETKTKRHPKREDVLQTSPSSSNQSFVLQNQRVCVRIINGVHQRHSIAAKDPTKIKKEK